MPAHPKLWIVILVCWMISLAAPEDRAQGNLVTDPSFERLPHHYGIVANDVPSRTGQVTDSVFFGANTWFLEAIPGIEGGGSVDIASTTQGFGKDVSEYEAAHGDRVVDLIGTINQGALNQYIPTTPGQKYIISFSTLSNNENQLHLDRSMWENKQLQVWWNGQLQGTYTAPLMFEDWEPVQLPPLMATETMTKLGFLGLVDPGTLNPEDGVLDGIPVSAGEPTNGALVDAVHVTAAIPEPSVVLALLLVACVFGVHRLRSALSAKPGSR